MTLKIPSVSAVALAALLASGWNANATANWIAQDYDCKSLMELNTANVTGKWVAQIPGRQGTTETTFTLKADGEKLTGAVSNPQGEDPISEGKITDGDISFVVAVSFGGNKMKLLYKGKVSGDEIKFTRQIQGDGMGGPPPGSGSRRVQEFVAKRVK
jgi:hypothetical protein